MGGVPAAEGEGAQALTRGLIWRGANGRTGQYRRGDEGHVPGGL